MPMYRNGKGPLQPVLTFKPFMKWGLNYMGPIKPLTHDIGNQYIIIVTYYTMKRVEAKASRDNIVRSTVKFCTKTVFHVSIVLPTWLMIKEAIS